jgi:formylglycine-generating enzyme required for sulfatase activity
MRNLLFFVFLFMISQSWAQDKAKIEKLLEFVKVEGGTYTMGFEETAHQVELSSFYMQKTEVIQELWEAVMGSNPSQDKTWKDNPVTNVNWNDCGEFIIKLNSITGEKYRLPTEAEWEYAARGGKLSKGYKYSGSDDLNEVAWSSENSNLKLHPVAEKKPNELGLYDMSGNVYEWCSDWYGDYRPKAQKDPFGPDNGDVKVMRGGGWGRDAEDFLVANRYVRFPVNGSRSVGFRLCSPVK